MNGTIKASARTNALIQDLENILAVQLQLGKPGEPEGAEQQCQSAYFTSLPSRLLYLILSPTIPSHRNNVTNSSLPVISTHFSYKNIDQCLKNVFNCMPVIIVCWLRQLQKQILTCMPVCVQANFVNSIHLPSLTSHRHISL